MEYIHGMGEWWYVSQKRNTHRERERVRLKNPLGYINIHHSILVSTKQQKTCLNEWEVVPLSVIHYGVLAMTMKEHPTVEASAPKEKSR